MEINTKFIIIAAITILAIFLIALAQIPLGIEPLTELYFENHTTLPKYLFLNKTYNFPFTMRNLEYQEVKYNYTLLLQNETGETFGEIDKGSVPLSNNGSKTIDEVFKIMQPFKRAKVSIEITKERLSIPEFKKKLWWPDPN